MGRKHSVIKQSILDLLQRARGYQNCRVRPSFSDKGWLAETFTPDLLRPLQRKSWKALMEAGAVRTFTSPDLAMQALIEWRGEQFDEPPMPPLGIQLL